MNHKLVISGVVVVLLAIGFIVYWSVGKSEIEGENPQYPLAQNTAAIKDTELRSESPEAAEGPDVSIQNTQKTVADSAEAEYSRNVELIRKNMQIIEAGPESPEAKEALEALNQIPHKDIERYLKENNIGTIEQTSVKRSEPFRKRRSTY